LKRYFLVESLKGSDIEAIAAASLFVSGKVCEYLRACKDIIYCCRKVYTKDSEVMSLTIPRDLLLQLQLLRAVVKVESH